MTDQQFLDWCAQAGNVRVILVEVVANIAGTETTLYLSTKPYVTESTDTPANTSYEACIIDGVQFSSSLSFDGTASMSSGDIEIYNFDGQRDGWFNYVWANRQVKVFVGDPRWARSDFRQIFDGIVGDLVSRDRGVLNLHLLDKLQRLNQPLTENKLGGTGPNKDRLIPLCFGECFNVSPLLIDAANLTYQVHDGPIEGIIEVRSSGAVPVSNTPNPANGTFRLTSSPYEAVITASVQGAKPATYANDISSLVQLIMTSYGPTTTRLTTADLDLANFSAFATANPQPVGLYAAERMNVLEACQQLANSVGAAIACTSMGLVRLVKIALPATGTPTTIEPADIAFHTLSVADRPPVKSTCTLGYDKNWTVQDSVAAGVVQSSVPLFKDEWMTVTSTDAVVNSLYRLNQAPPQEDSLLLVDTDAQAEADRRRDLWKTPRTVYSLECFAQKMLLELGDAVTITSPRFGLSGGATGIVIGVERDWIKCRIKLKVLV